MLEWADNFVRAVAYWLEYERLCGRENLLSEASLKTPVAEYLKAVQDHELIAEVPYPEFMQPTGRGRRRSVDFCLCRPGGAQAWTAILEVKWVNGRREILPEIFDDLCRLEVARRRKEEQTEPFDRFLLIAGYCDSLQTFVMNKTIKIDVENSIQISRILPDTINASTNISVASSTGELLEYWRDSGMSLELSSLPLSMNINLIGMVRVHMFCCYL